MTSRERELLDATKNVFIVQCLCDPTVPGLDRLASAIDAYATTAQQDHEAMLATRRAEDGGRMHPETSGAE